MAAKHKNIEKRFIRELENLELQPSPQVWEKVSARLAWKEFMQFNPQSFNVYYAVALLGFAILTIYLSVFRNNTKDLLSPEPEPRTEISGSSLIHADESGKAISLEASADSSILDITQTDVPEMEKTSTVQPSAPVAEKFTQKTPTTTPTDSSLTNSLIHSPEDIPTLLRPVALFSPSVMEGCVPLKVWFSNYSVNALQYSWSFSDGGTSESMNPIYVFDEPGTYFISLTVVSSDNLVNTKTETIRVHGLPEVIFDADLPENAESRDPVYFYNYSRGASTFRWDFGDGNTSDVKDPSHSYRSPGHYDIKLVAVSPEGCTDSLILSDVFTDVEPELIFPSAFSPNISGATGGYFSGRERNNEVFYPYTSAQTDEYRLRIFNRQGNLIFESNDINMGWDGYYRQELQPAGVYVWKVRARFTDGRILVKAGDVTLFYRP